jgi:prepilin-type N-terminal cleavage/methylation domain-containing protein
MSATNKRGFTLIEILIVVIILGVLASLVVPLFAEVSNDARRAALSDQLHGIRVQIQLFTLQHGDTPPNLNGANWDDLVTQTFYRGEPRGPYLPSIPRNTLNQFSNVAVVNADPAFGDPVAGANIGFVYNPNTGVIWATNTAGNRVYNEANPRDPNN